MALVGNYAVISKTPGRFLSGTSLSGDRTNFGTNGEFLNRLSVSGAPMAKFSAIPNGYLPPYMWALPRTSGGMATYTSLTALMSSTATASGGKNLVAALSAAIALTNGDLGLIVSLIAAISGSGVLTNAQLAASAGMSAAISAAGSITDAQLGAIVSMLSSIAASGSLSLNDFATADMTADISSVTALSPQSLATAVWASLLSDNNVSDSFGDRVQKLLQLAQYLGLK